MRKRRTFSREFKLEAIRLLAKGEPEPGKNVVWTFEPKPERDR